MVTIKGKQYQVSPIDLGRLRDLTREGHVAALSTDIKGYMNEAQVNAAIALISASLITVHPECNRDWVADNINVSEAPACLQAALIASGFIGNPDGPKAVSP